MKQITFYLDFISPFAYLAFEALPQALQGLNYSVTYQPVFLGGLLRHHGQLGPAEVPPKRDWTYRHVLWLAAQQGIPFQMPAAHPFNPLGLLRLAVASDARGLPNRFVCETLLRHVLVGGADAADPARLKQVAEQFELHRQPDDPANKDLLQAHTAQAVEQGVFGVPAYVVDGKVFWGLDALPMLRAYLEGSAWFEGDNWEGVSKLPSGIPLRKPATPV